MRDTFSISAMNEKIRLDDHSKKILRELQSNGQLTVQEISERVGLSATPCWRRIKEMEQNGIIRRYTALLDREMIGLQICVLAHVSLSQHHEKAVRRFEKVVSECEEVVECFGTTGEADYVLKIMVSDLKAYEAFLHSAIFQLPDVANIRSMVVLKDVKCETALRIE